jgi:hypothetical protein
LNVIFRRRMYFFVCALAQLDRICRASLALWSRDSSPRDSICRYIRVADGLCRWLDDQGIALVEASQSHIKQKALIDQSFSHRFLLIAHWPGQQRSLRLVNAFSGKRESMVRTWVHIGFATPLLLTWCSVDRLLRKLPMSWDTSHWGAQAFTRNWTRGVSSRLLFHGLEVRDETCRFVASPRSLYCIGERVGIFSSCAGKSPARQRHQGIDQRPNRS